MEDMMTLGLQGEKTEKDADKEGGKGKNPDGSGEKERSEKDGARAKKKTEAPRVDPLVAGRAQVEAEKMQMTIACPHCRCRHCPRYSSWNVGPGRKPLALIRLRECQQCARKFRTREMYRVTPKGIVLAGDEAIAARVGVRGKIDGVSGDPAA